MSPAILPISSTLATAIRDTQLPPTLGFGKVRTPIMVASQFRDGEWQPLTLRANEPIALDPAAKVLHYGQAIFEGMKAYKNAGRVVLFRPQENAKRFNQSAARLAMPALPENTFVSACLTMAHHLASLVPSGEGESLYLRPAMIATEVGLGLAAAKEYLFFVIATPSGKYFAPGKVHVLIERHDCRAAPGGTGAAKAAGNYAASLPSLLRSGAKNYQQNMWLDARNMKYIEELSGMNFFAVIDGELHTPALTDSILPGITRSSVIALARELGFVVHERPLAVDDVITDLKSGRCREMFACGTAAVVTPVAALGEEDGTLYPAPEEFGPVSQQIRQRLVAIQRCQEPGPEGWIVEAAAAN